MIPETRSRPSVVVVGAGFAGCYAARTLERLLPPDAAELTVISSTDHLCYSPLLPEVATGVSEARHIAVSLRRALPGRGSCRARSPRPTWQAVP